MPRPEGEAVGDGHADPPRNLALLLRFYGFDHHELAHRAFVHELDAARYLGKESVVFAATDVESGLHASAALADDDGAAGDDLSAECFEAKPLGIRVAAV